MSVIGISFGDQSCVLTLAKRGGVETVLNESSKRKTPTMVSFQGKQRFMGDQAQALARGNYKNTLVEMKRLLGLKFSDPATKRELERMPNAAQFVQLPNDAIGVKVHFNDEALEFTPVDAIAMSLAHLKQIAEHAADGKPVVDTVVSVPAYFTQHERSHLLAAAKIAGLDVQETMNNTTAVALDFGIWKSARKLFSETERQIHMFVDVGHSATTVSVVAFVTGRLEVLATACDRNLGGRDVDWALMNHFADEFKAKYKQDPRENPKSLVKLLTSCEKAKSTLTPDGVAFSNLNVEFLVDEIDFNSKITLEKFEELCEPLLPRLDDVVRRALEMCRLEPKQVQSVEIVGGGSRVRCFKRRVASAMGLDPSQPNFGLSTTLNADESEARGACLRSAMLSPHFRVQEFAVKEIAMYGIRIMWDQRSPGESGAEMADGADGGAAASGKNEVQLIKAGETLPVSRRVTFGNSPMTITASYDPEIVSSGAVPASTELVVAKFTISGVPALPPNVESKAAKIRVSFKVDGSCMLSVDSASHSVPKAVEADASANADAEDDSADAGAKDKKDDAAGGPKAEGEDGDGDAAMKDASAGTDDKQEQQQPDKKTKRKMAVTELKVAVDEPGAVPSADLQNAVAREREFQAHDKILRDTADMRNRLETYIYSMRDKIDSSLREFATEAESADIKAELGKAEDWLYNEGFDETKAVYEEHLNKLRAVGDKVERRSKEVELRGEAQADFAKTLQGFLAVANSTEAKFEHISQEERDTVRSACAEAEKWLIAESEKQAALPLSVDPVLTYAAIAERLKVSLGSSSPPTPPPSLFGSCTRSHTPCVIMTLIPPL